MAAHDGPDTLHYVDPPYMGETRGRGDPFGAKHYYRHELSIADHEKLLGCLRWLQGMVMLSGYPTRLYNRLLSGWTWREATTLADGGRERVEVLWFNPACTAAIEARALPLFERA